MEVPKHFIIKIEMPNGELIDSYEVTSSSSLIAVLGNIGGKHQMMQLPVHNIGMKTMLATIFMSIVDAESRKVNNDRKQDHAHQSRKIEEAS